MADLKFRIELLGGHVHAQMFAGKDVDHLAKVGDLTFRKEEWDLFIDVMWKGHKVRSEEIDPFGLWIEGPRG